MPIVLQFSHLNQRNFSTILRDDNVSKRVNKQRIYEIVARKAHGGVSEKTRVTTSAKEKKDRLETDRGRKDRRGGALRTSSEVSRTKRAQQKRGYKEQRGTRHIVIKGRTRRQ